MKWTEVANDIVIGKTVRELLHDCTLDDHELNKCIQYISISSIHITFHPSTFKFGNVEAARKFLLALLLQQKDQINLLPIYNPNKLL